MLHTISLLLLFLQISSNPDYQKIFGNDYTDALKYFEKNKLVISAHFNKGLVDKELIAPIIFPERIRYSMVRDLIETAAVELIYIDFGSDYVDFSIGDFQIKPSFAEKVESFINQSDILSTKYRLLINYREEEKRKKRKERVRRLKLQNYQLIYIAAFYDIVKQRFDLSRKSKVDKIKFIATAYNHGFDEKKIEIEKRIDDCFFPYGTKYKGKQYAYTDVAVDFYLNHYREIFE
jgi:hypothetical protein